MRIIPAATTSDAQRRGAKGVIPAPIAQAAFKTPPKDAIPCRAKGCEYARQDSNRQRSAPEWPLEGAPKLESSRDLPIDRLGRGPYHGSQPALETVFVRRYTSITYGHLPAVQK